MSPDKDDKIVAFSGPRDLWVPRREVQKALDWAMHDMSENPKQIICGGATGIDSCVVEYCLDNLGVTPRIYPAWWKFYPGGTAGPIRNREMVVDSDICIAIRDTRLTRGTSDFVLAATVAGKFVEEYAAEEYQVMDYAMRNKHRGEVFIRYRERKLEELRRFA